MALDREEQRQRRARPWKYAAFPYSSYPLWPSWSIIIKAYKTYLGEAIMTAPADGKMIWKSEISSLTQAAFRRRFLSMKMHIVTLYSF